MLDQFHQDAAGGAGVEERHQVSAGAGTGGLIDEFVPLLDETGERGPERVRVQPCPGDDFVLDQFVQFPGNGQAAAIDSGSRSSTAPTKATRTPWAGSSSTGEPTAPVRRSYRGTASSRLGVATAT